MQSVWTNPHPDPLPFTKGEGNLRWHRVRVTEQGSKTGGRRFRLHTAEGGTRNGTASVRVFDLCDETGLVRVIEIQLSHLGATFLRGNHVGPFEQETAFVLDSNGLGVAADGVLDRFKGQRDRRTHAHAAVQAVYFEVKRDILRVEKLRDGFGDDLKRHAAFLACGDSLQGFALPGIRLLFKKQREGAI